MKWQAQPHHQRAGLRFVLAAVLHLTTVSAFATPGRAVLLQRPSDLFKLTNVWTVHFQFTAKEWDAMEPEGGEPRFFGGGFGGPRGRGRVDAGTLAPAFFRDGDKNHDDKLSGEEFSALADKWFSRWDKDKRGKLDIDQVREGLRSLLGPGAGGPGGRNLQGAEGKRNGLASASGIEFNYVHAEMEFEGQRFKDVAVRYKGNGTFMRSRGTLKRSLKVELNKYVKGQKLAGIAKLNFHNNVTDASWMNEVLSHRLYRDAGVPAPRTSYARVYVSVPGRFMAKYFGLYSIVEDIDRVFLEENLATKKGAILKPATLMLFGDLGDDWKYYNQSYDPKTDLSIQEQRRVIEFARFVTSSSDSEFATKLGDYLNLDEFARFMAVTVYLSTLDSILGMGHNFYVYLEPQAHRFQFLPWDLDNSFGQFGMAGSQEERENLSIHRPWRGENWFLERVFKVEAFKKLYLARMAEFSAGIFKPERFDRQVNEIAKAIRIAVQDESSEMLARFDTVVAGGTVERLGFGGGGFFGGRGGFQQTAKPIKPFVKARSASILAQLEGKSEGDVLADFRFGGRGGPGGFGPANPLVRAFMAALDTNGDEQLTHDEFVLGFAKWFKVWNTDRSGALTDPQIRTGLAVSLSPNE